MQTHILTNQTRQQWEERYLRSDLPWDSGITPPEVVHFWQSDYLAGVAERSSALDLGCGTATNLIYMAALGLRVVGVEIAGNALSIASERLSRIDVQERRRITLIQGSVSALPLRQLKCCYVLDIGCLHTILPEERPNYMEGMLSNLGSRGYYHLYGFDKIGDSGVQYQRGLEENEVVELLGGAAEAVSIQKATPAPHPCRWYLFRKR